ncbi:MAG: heterodisulfide reductase-related iron-sulfur binding cluster [Methanomassiliicoccaceae archaeon]|nr:heterodisulfide reductase-related iron-sulfur binding cluster [Methanomassiliicoccaceae archaeon]
MGKKPLVVKMPRIQKEILACLQCGYCIEVCEAHAQTPWESVTPRGKIYYLTQLDKKNMMDKLLNRKVEAGDDFADAIYKCTGCGNCEEVCHAGLELVSFWERIRAWLVDLEVGPLPAHKKLTERISVNRNPYGEDPASRDAWWPENVERAAVPDVIMFAGCTGSYRMQHIPKAGVEVLDRAGVKQNCLGPDEYCCTSPALRTGVKTLTRKSADHVVNKADGMGAKDMIMTCSGCFKTVSTDFGDHYSKAGQEVYHFTQYINKLMTSKKLAFNHPMNAKVTYHDPCHLGRHSKVFDEPRNVLKRIKGVQLVEMDKNKENSRCCGAGGGYKSAFNDFAVNIAIERIKDAEEVGAEIIATACPFCVLNLSAGAKNMGSKVKVMDISEILLKVTAPVEEEVAPPASVAVVEVPEPVVALVVETPPVAEIVEEKPVVEEVMWKVQEETPEEVVEVVTEEIMWKVDDEVPQEEPASEAEEEIIEEFIEEIVEEEPVDEYLYVNEELLEEEPIDAEYIEEEIVEEFVAEEIIEEEPVAAYEYVEPLEEVVEEEEDDSEYEEKVDDDIFMEERPEDDAELKLRRRLWWGGYRYRRHYGKENANLAYIRAKVAVFVSEEKDDATDEALKNRGWTVLRFMEDKITDARREANRVMAAVDKNLILKVADDHMDKDILRKESADDSADLKIRRRLWSRGYRYWKTYGEEKITIAFPSAKVAAFVSKRANDSVDESLRAKGWTVMRFIEKTVTDGRKEAYEIMDAVDRSLGLTVVAGGSDEDVLREETEEDSAELRLRRRLWSRGYKYRKSYGLYNITIAFPQTKVAVLVGPEKDDLVDRALGAEGWTVLRYMEDDITDARKEADEVMDTINRNLFLMAGADEHDAEVHKEWTPYDSAELKLRRRLWWNGYRYRRHYGEEDIHVAYIGAKVAVFVSKEIDDALDESLEMKDWAVMRFMEDDITDAWKEAEEVMDAVDDSLGMDMYDLAYLLVDTPELRLRRAVWNKRLRYRRNYGRDKIDVAFVRWRVAVFVDEDGLRKPVDDSLSHRGWTVLRYRASDITDGKKQAEEISAIVKGNKREQQKPKKKAKASVKKKAPAKKKT